MNKELSEMTQEELTAQLKELETARAAEYKSYSKCSKAFLAQEAQIRNRTSSYSERDSKADLICGIIDGNYAGKMKRIRKLLK